MLLAVLLAPLPASFATVHAEEPAAAVAPVTDTRSGVTAAVMCGMSVGLAMKGVPGAIDGAIFFCGYMIADALLTPDRP
jgi:hypothetical protein